MKLTPFFLTIMASLALNGCGESAKLDISEGSGPTPKLPEPVVQKVPTIKIAKAVGWSESNKPVAAEGLSVKPFAQGLNHPRWLYQLPNGDILVAETNFVMQGLDGSIKGWFAKHFLAKAGAIGNSPDRITLLRDTNGDGQADVKKFFISGLHSPFGMALVGNTFYVANADSIVQFPYKEGETSLDVAPKKLLDLPGLPLNHHWTKNILPNMEGTKLYVTVGSNSNVGENGMDIEKGRAAIWEVDLTDGSHRIFASGLRNPNGMAWEPETKTLWTVVNERDEIGSDLVPDYMTSVQEGGFYGWPYSYYGRHIDPRVKPQNPDLVAKAIVPDYALGAHTASLGLADATGNTLGQTYKKGMFIGQHGSWNRKPYSGYKVIFVPFKAGKPSGMPVDVLYGFINAAEDAQGRPVGVLIQKTGELLVADDVGNTIWQVSAQ